MDDTKRHHTPTHISSTVVPMLDILSLESKQKKVQSTANRNDCVAVITENVNDC